MLQNDRPVPAPLPTVCKDDIENFAARPLRFPPPKELSSVT